MENEWEWSMVCLSKYTNAHDLLYTRDTEERWSISICACWFSREYCCLWWLVCFIREKCRSTREFIHALASGFRDRGAWQMQTRGRVGVAFEIVLHIYLTNQQRIAELLSKYICITCCWKYSAESAGLDACGLKSMDKWVLIDAGPVGLRRVVDALEVQLIMPKMLQPNLLLLMDPKELTKWRMNI